MTIEAVFQAICERPEDDDLRLQYAELVESSDPEHAEYIRLSIADAIRRRDHQWSAHSERLSELGQGNEERWARDLIRFLPRHQNSDGSINVTYHVMFDRGFPTQITIHPLVFLEYADLVFRLAPIRHVRFREPYDQEEYVSGSVPKLPDGSWEQFPLDQILAMPQLSRLHSVGFDMADLVGRNVMPEDTWARVAACPYLTRCLALDSRGVSIYRNLDALAEGRLTSKMLRLDPIGTVSDVGERRYDDLDSEHGAHTRTVFETLGLELEKKHGYIPWLHPSHCKGALYDLAYYVEQGELPRYKPGTPPMQEWYEFPIEVHRRQPWREW